MNIDKAIFELLPHRPPMLLIQRIINIADDTACAELTVNQDSTFYIANLGVPSWIGLEYMGQTCALIGGHQQQLGKAEASLGFLMGSRHFEASVSYFPPQSELQIHCKQVAIVGDTLANFDCSICYAKADNTSEVLARATLSVFRKPLTSA